MNERERVYVALAGAYLPEGEYLITVEADSVTVAYREVSWHGWGPPIEAEQR